MAVMGHSSLSALAEPAGRSKILRGPWLVLSGALIFTLLFRIAIAGASTAPLVGSAPVRDAVAELLVEDAGLRQLRSDIDPETLRVFYGRREFNPLWTGDVAAETRAVLVLNALETAQDDGLNLEDYAYSQLVERRQIGSPAAQAEFELLMTDSFFRYAHDLRIGRVLPTSVYSIVDLPVQSFDAAAALEAALESGSMTELLADLAPPHPEYARLRQALREYRAKVDAGGWSDLPRGIEVTADGGDPGLELLRLRLAAEDNSVALRADEVGNVDLIAGFTGYQARNGLDPDGVLGPRTLAMLNVPASDRVAQIIANMERWRWVPRRFETRYISVNVPDASLEVIDSGRSALVSRVIVGQPRTPTPIFRAMVSSVTVNPPWNVPYSIARNEILPLLQGDPQYLVSKNMVLVNGPPGDPHGLSIDWNAVSRVGFPYQIRQLPGPGSALGVVKLELPNPFSVFLHDTPGKRAFAASERFLSHGCVRVQEILPLASYVLNRDAADGREELDLAIATAMTRSLPLDEPIPVYVLYWTAVTNSDGTFGFRRDIYGRDSQLLAKLASLNAQPSLAMQDLSCRMAG